MEDDMVIFSVAITFTDAAPDPTAVESAIEKALILHLEPWDIEEVNAEVAPS